MHAAAPASIAVLPETKVETWYSLSSIVGSKMASDSSLPSLSSLSEALPEAEGWTAEEISAIKETKKLLLAEGVPPAKISPLELSLCVMNCKLRPPKAVQKYKDWLASLEVFGIHSMQEVWNGQDAKARMQEEWTSTLTDEFSSYATPPYLNNTTVFC